MKILVTGGVGFIGSHLCEKLIEIGYEVICIDNFNNYYNQELKILNAKEIEKKGVKIIRKDLRDGNYAEILKDVTYIFHLAAQPGISELVSFGEFLENNVIATQVLLSLIQKNSKKLKMFVNISTSSVYGKFAMSDETKIPQPTSYYGVTKLAAEQLVLALQREANFPATSLRLFSVYGPRERPDKFFTKYIDACLNNKEFSLFEGSEQHTRSFSFISDIIDGIIKTLEFRDKCVGEIFNIGSEKTFSTKEAMNVIEEITGKKPKIKFLPRRPGDQQGTFANIDKAKRVLNYQPRIDLREGVLTHVNWLKKNDLFQKR
jgi:nucleoside-diphosphate-sugar epimerase